MEIIRNHETKKRNQDVLNDLRLWDFGIANAQSSTFIEQMFADELGRCLAGVASVGLEGKTENGNSLIGYRTEQTFGNSKSKSTLLVIVHENDLR